VSTTSTISVPRDGGAMDLFLWTPDSPPNSAILVVQEIFGVGPYIRAVAERLAALGYLVGAPDVFWRFAPGWEGGHDQAGLTASMEQAGKMDFPMAVADCLAGMDVLAAAPGITAAPGVMGFCMGGTLAWGVAVQGEPSVCISYYGSGVPSMIGQIGSVTCPTLFHFGNEDAFLPNEGVDAIAAAIAGRPQFVINVEAAGHAFDNHESEMFYNEAAAHASWTKTVAFLTTNLPA